MSSIPKAVIHINFLPGELLFDARPIWTALNLATSKGQVPTLSKKLGEEPAAMAIHLGTRLHAARSHSRVKCRHQSDLGIRSHRCRRWQH